MPAISATAQESCPTSDSDAELPQDEVLAQFLFGHSIQDLSPLQIVQLATAVAQLPPPPPPPATVWSFLGIPQGYRWFRDNAFNRSGNRPGLERKPPLKAIADPKNLASPNPAIAKAAEVKQAEDLAPQKIKAVKYLASIGCGCYNRDGSITDAMIKAMDDCTEAVRLATVQTISEAAAGEMCSNCKMRSCCSEEISNKLYEIAYERDDTGCYLEPSERVRLSAAEALRTCCPGGDEDFIIERGPPPVRGGEQPGVLGDLPDGLRKVQRVAELGDDLAVDGTHPAHRAGILGAALAGNDERGTPAGGPHLRQHPQQRRL